MIKEILSKIQLKSQADVFNPNIPFNPPISSSPALNKAVIRGWEKQLNQGKPLDDIEVESFEKEISDLFGKKFCVTVGSGTDALVIALRSLRLPPGSKVAVPGFTFVSSASCILENNLEPVFVDVSIDSGLASADSFLELVEKKGVAAIVVPHLYGQMVDLRSLYRKAKQQNIWIIEDSAQAFGSKLAGFAPGAYSDLNCLSFDPQKILSAFGSGGAILTDSPDLAQAAREIRCYGHSGSGKFNWVGINSRLHSVQALLLSKKLKEINFKIQRRKEVAQVYREQLTNIESINWMKSLPERTNNEYRFIIKVVNRERFLKVLSDNGVETRIHYQYPVYYHPPFSKYLEKALPGCEFLSSTNISLPIYPELNQLNLEKIIETLKKAAKTI